MASYEQEKRKYRFTDVPLAEELDPASAFKHVKFKPSKRFRRCLSQSCLGLSIVAYFFGAWIVLITILVHSPYYAKDCAPGNLGIFEPSILWGRRLSIGEAKAIDVAFNLVIVFILALPTLMDSMTGYGQRQQWVFRWPNGTVVPKEISDSWVDGAIVPSHTSGCEPTPKGTHYGWGFSFYWFQITYGTLGLWLIGTYAMWMDTQHNSEIVRGGHRMGTFRATLDLAEVMKKVLGPNTDHYTEEDLAKALLQQPWIKYERVEGGERGRISVKLVSRSRNG
ncbi:hypothetical protein BGZ60DRAFT_538598 [Tricladium varicosporioides]|nr:hypothetical protein BGZ60DRAFT_538598 [Hymenoscyphus varicosporioides]